MKRLKQAEKAISYAIAQIDSFWSLKSSKHEYFDSLEELSKSVRSQMSKNRLFMPIEIERVQNAFSNVLSNRTKCGYKDSVYEPTTTRAIDSLKAHLFKLNSNLVDRKLPVYLLLWEWACENKKWLIPAAIGAISIVLKLMDFY